MKSVAAWLPFALLLLPAGSSPAQAPRPQPDQPEAKGKGLLTAEPVKDDPKDDELRKLLKARYNEALTEVQGLLKLYQAARVSFDSVAEAQQRLMQAGLELYDKPADKIALLTQYVELTKAAEQLARARLDAARGLATTLSRARYQRLDAEIQLLRAKRAAEKAKGK